MIDTILPRGLLRDLDRGGVWTELATGTIFSATHAGWGFAIELCETVPYWATIPTLNETAADAKSGVVFRGGLMLLDGSLFRDSFADKVGYRPIPRTEFAMMRFTPDADLAYARRNGVKLAYYIHHAKGGVAVHPAVEESRDFDLIYQTKRMWSDWEELFTDKGDPDDIDLDAVAGDPDHRHRWEGAGGGRRAEVALSKSGHLIVLVVDPKAYRMYVFDPDCGEKWRGVLRSAFPAFELVTNRDICPQLQWPTTTSNPRLVHLAEQFYTEDGLTDTLSRYDLLKKLCLPLSVLFCFYLAELGDPERAAESLKRAGFSPDELVTRSVLAAAIVYETIPFHEKSLWINRHADFAQRLASKTVLHRRSYNLESAYRMIMHSLRAHHATVGPEANQALKQFDDSFLRPLMRPRPPPPALPAPPAPFEAPRFRRRARARSRPRTPHFRRRARTRSRPRRRRG